VGGCRGCLKQRCAPAEFSSRNTTTWTYLFDRCADFSVLASVLVVTDVNKPINTMLLALKLSLDYHKMSATPNVVADPIDDGTL